MNPFIRIEALLGDDFKKIKRGRVAIVGVGGVGSHAAIALARIGLGSLILMDPDTIKASNFNRHVQGFTRYIDKNKAEAMKEEILGFRNMDIRAIPRSYGETQEDELFREKFDLLLDCIDVITYKLQLIEACQRREIPFITSLGTGNRIKPIELEISTLYQSQGCALARVLRREARKRNLQDFPVVLSKETAQNLVLDEKEGSRHLPASSYFTPAAAGQLLAYWAVEKLRESK